MSSGNDSGPVDIAVNVVRQWKETYRWIPIFGAVAAIEAAFLTGGNNLPAPVCVFLLGFMFIAIGYSHCLHIFMFIDI